MHISVCTSYLGLASNDPIFGTPRNLDLILFWIEIPFWIFEDVSVAMVLYFYNLAVAFVNWFINLSIGYKLAVILSLIIILTILSSFVYFFTMFLILFIVYWISGGDN